MAPPCKPSTHQHRGLQLFRTSTPKLPVGPEVVGIFGAAVRFVVLGFGGFGASTPCKTTETRRTATPYARYIPFTTQRPTLQNPLQEIRDHIQGPYNPKPETLKP